jgi:2-methylisocitrate lyase-like PEP mutase family enzyme
MRNPPGAGYAAGQEAMEMSATQSDKAEAFRALHREGCFVMPNPWDAGSARRLAGMGFAALATSSGAAAAVPGWRDGEPARDKALAHAELREAGVRRISLATSLYRAAVEGLRQAADEARRGGHFGLLDRRP